MTTFDTIYEAFLEKIEEDKWNDTDLLEDYKKEWRSYLDGAIGFFKFPRCSLAINTDNTGFVSDLSRNEIEILVGYMKVEWLHRNILTWEKIKTQYGERDFSQANLLDKLDKTYKTAIERAERREKNYYRSINGTVFDYTRLAGD